MDAHALTIRPARVDEARVMAVMSRDLIEDGLRWRYSPPRMAALIRDPDTTAIVACDTVGPKGLAVMQFGDAKAHLVLLCVDPKHRRCGTGRSLLTWLVESAEVAGIVSIHLELRADNAGACAFYRKLGFIETVIVPGYYSETLAARRMSRLLRPPRH